MFLKILQLKKNMSLHFGLRIGPKYEKDGKYYGREANYAIPYTASDKPHPNNEFIDHAITFFYTVLIYNFFDIPKKFFIEYLTSLITKIINNTMYRVSLNFRRNIKSSSKSQN